ncbi:MAG: hypothetical protein HFI06_06740 [Eubacterium sp.]|jgi:hypothetical protein|nr:hypothetical protein [Eubacterium sp.]NBI86599.1 hypothetical protein [Lachnospiraceae bacterium]
MSYTIQVRMKKLGKQRANSLAPVPFVLESRPQTTRDLITALTALGVKDYNARKDEGQLLPYLTREEIAGQAERGKIAFGLRNGEDADESAAIQNAIQCFEDGIYRIFAGETELTALNDEIPQANDTVFTFIRLTMLSGW